MTKSPAEGVPPPEQNGPKAHRPLYLIASDIRADWPKPYFGAVPYLFALRHLNRASDMYGADSALSIIAYFLSNARTWRGPRATALKNELRDILKGHGYE
jgi:hypothetical protein